MEATVQAVLNQIGEYGYAAIFAAMVLTGLGVPLPGELTLGFTGYLVYSNQLAWGPAVAVTAAGDLLGAMISYYLGILIRTGFTARYLGFLIPSEPKITAITRWLNHYGLVAVVGGRLLPVVRGAIPIPAGFVRMNAKAYLAANSISSILWCSALIYAGISLGHNWQQLAGLGNTVGLAAGGLALVLLVGYFVFCARN